MSSSLVVSRRNRRTPYTDRVEACGVQDYSIVNHMLLPKSFNRSVEEDYWHLKRRVQLWDVSCQRQVELRGPDAGRLAQWMTPRDLSHMKVGQCFYAPLVDEAAGLLNDPVILMRAPNWFWFSIADADILLWAKGLALGMDLDVEVTEPDVSPLAVQGPRAEDLVALVFGEEVRSLRYFQFRELPFADRCLVVARSGYSKQGGFEIYLDDSALGGLLWDTLWESGGVFDVAPGCPNLIERVEGGLLSYGNEMTRENNPFEINLDRFCRLDGKVDYVGRVALQKIAESGPSQRIRGIVFEGRPCPPCAAPWPITIDKKVVGQVTTAIWSPAFRKNIALGMVTKDHWTFGQAVDINLPDGETRRGNLCQLPLR